MWIFKIPQEKVTNIQGSLIATDLGIQSCEDFTRTAAVAGGRSKQGFGDGHEQRRRYSLTLYVAYGKT